MIMNDYEITARVVFIVEADSPEAAAVKLGETLTDVAYAWDAFEIVER
jgi:hypothetical protein